MSLDQNSQPDLSNEQALIDRLRARDQSALTSIYDCYANIVYALAFRITGHQAEAKEVVIDTFWQVWRQVDRAELAQGSLGAWIMTMARSRALDRRRVMPRRPLTDSETGAQTAAAPPIANGTYPERKSPLTEQSMRVRAAWRELSAAQREAIELAFYHGLTHTEIAERLGESLGAIRSHISLGLMTLREQLGVQLEALEQDTETSLA